MKKMLVLVLALVSSPWLGAHNRSFALDQGQVVLGVTPGGGSGYESEYKVGPVRNGRVGSAELLLIPSQNSATWGGDAVSLEYGVSDTVAVGVKSSGLMMLTSGLSDGRWVWRSGLWSSFDWGRQWLEAPHWGLTWDTAVQFDPLVDTSTEGSTSLINVISTQTVSFRLLDNETASLAFFNDWGVMVSVPNAALNARWSSSSKLRQELIDSDWSMAANARVTVAPFTAKAVTEVGVEARVFRRASLILGAGRNVADFFQNDPAQDPAARLVEHWWGSVELKYQL